MADLLVERVHALAIVARRLGNSCPRPFGLSLSKAAPFFCRRDEEGVPFDKLRANGAF
jgi:hypothetical protein